MYEQESFEKERDYRKNVVLGDGLISASASRLPLGEQEELISMLHTAITELSSRLSPVLEPDYPTENTASDSATERDGSPLYNQMSANNRGISSARSKIDRLIQRIEC